MMCYNVFGQCALWHIEGSCISGGGSNAMWQKIDFSSFLSVVVGRLVFCLASRFGCNFVFVGKNAHLP
jgi:hypothetical protein